MESLGGQMSVRRIDIDANPQIASQYGIRNIPALVFLKDNQIVFKKMGVLSESQVKSIWNQI
jgi:thioredoxin 1